MPFPLPLTPFEYYYWSDDRPEYPMTFPLDLRFSGNLQREVFLTALRKALDQNPLLDARIDDRSAWPQWVSSGQSLPWVDWTDESAPITHPQGEYIDLRRESGLRIWVRTDQDTTRLQFQFHHACCDGMAAFGFIDYLLSCYALALGPVENPPELPALDVTKLAGRGDFSAHETRKLTWATAFGDLWVTIREWSKILFGNPTLLATPRPGSETATNAVAEKQSGRELLEFEIKSLSGEQVSQLRRMAHAHGVNLNELLARDLFLTLCDWNRRHAGSTRGRFRLNVPVNLRLTSDKTLPAANRLGFAFISHPSAPGEDDNASLALVHAEMQRNKKGRLSLYFLGGLTLASNVRGLLPWTLRRRRSFATMVFSNIGRPFAQSGLPRSDGRLVCGDLVLDRITGVPPIRPLTRGAIAAFEYADKMTFCLRCDPKLFRGEETRELLDAYLARLTDTANRAIHPAGALPN